MYADFTLGNYLLIVIFSMAVSMALIPVMIRMAPTIGMVDAPDPRKVHSTPIPRVGGVGIVIGTLVPLFIWLNMSDQVIAFLLGTIVLFVFGVWDDVAELGHYVKFIGQFAAVLLVVYYGDIWVQHFPFMGLDTLSPEVGKPFTVLAIVGAINALNHSDGLDGLAGGESLLSFAAVAYLAYMFEGALTMILACAIIGGVFGFLRFNSYPAQVFMGDSGSQVLGFTLGVLVVMLTQDVNTVASPAIALLLIGLPVADILAVFYLRWKGGMNLFRATRNHIHHRLLDLGFAHYQSVMAIYSAQALLVVSAILLPYESDYLLVGIYLAVVIFIFAALTVAERIGFRVNSGMGIERRIAKALFGDFDISRFPKLALETGVSVFFISSAIISESVPLDISIASILVLLIILLQLKWGNLLIYRLSAFVSVGVAAYLLSNNSLEWLTQEPMLVYGFFVLMALAAFVQARVISSDRFMITPMDYLVIIIVILTLIVTDKSASDMTWMVLQMIVMFYACELLIQQMARFRNKLTAAMIVMLAIVSLRGLL